jgi:hypothetical protein
MNERHGMFQSVPTPRPIGVDPTWSWEPRLAERNQTKNNIVVNFVEWIEEHQYFQTIGAMLVGIYSNLFIHDDGTPGASAKNEQGSWTFAAVGDYGAGTHEEALVAQTVANAKPELIITVGDNVYPTGRWQDYQRNFDPYYGEISKKIPFMPSLGNHDLYRDDLRPYFGHFKHIQGRPYYGYVYKNVHFMSLDGDEDLRAGSAQYRWLEEELKNSTQTYRVIYLHYPLYGRDAEDFKEIRTSLQPLLAKYHVQLVVTGHEHNYQRSYPIEGTTHILTGNGGQQVFPFAVKRGAHVAYRKATWGHVEFSVGPTRMVARAFDQNGRLIDTTVIPATGVADGQTGARLLHAA